MIAPLPDAIIAPIVAMALAEDLGQAGDLTTDAIIRPSTRARFAFKARKSGVMSGMSAAALTLKTLDPFARLDVHVDEGEHFEAGATLAIMDGPARVLLMAERTMLNFLGPLCGVATLTNQFVEQIKGTKAKIAATRKTLPGLRALQKRAVLAGGGTTHRYGLSDAILIKDNHIAAAGSIEEALTQARAVSSHLTTIEVEVDSLAQLALAIPFKPDVIMLDNFSLADLAKAVGLVDGKITLEASGGVNLSTVRAIAQTGVDMISIGALTHSAPNIDIGLDAI